jgi:hypothetical protein
MKAYAWKGIVSRNNRHLDKPLERNGYRRPIVLARRLFIDTRQPNKGEMRG